jgi:hypothetical protein
MTFRLIKNTSRHNRDVSSKEEAFMLPS